MGADQAIDWRATAISALEWWREAGVDVELADAPRDWLATITAPDVPAAVAKPVATQFPATLAAFTTWRVGEHAPELAWGVPFVPATGPVDAPLMVLVEMPEREDASEGRLLGGKCGQLFDRMLAAIGLDRDRVHIASIAAARPIAGRIPREAIGPLTAMTKHHVGLVQPKALLLLGNAPCQVMLGDLCQQARGSLRPINHDGGTLTVATFHPAQLLERPQWKAESWKDLQMLQQALAS